MTDDALRDLIASAIAEGMVLHTTERHAFSTEDVNILIAEHRELYDGLRPDMALVVMALYGKHEPTVVDPDHYTGGLVAEIYILSNQMDALVRNGNGPRRRGVFEYSIAAAVIAASGAFVTAVVVALLGIL